MADYDGSTIHIQNGQTLSFTLGAGTADSSSSTTLLPPVRWSQYSAETQYGYALAAVHLTVGTAAGTAVNVKVSDPVGSVNYVNYTGNNGGTPVVIRPGVELTDNGATGLSAYAHPTIGRRYLTLDITNSNGGDDLIDVTFDIVAAE